LPETGRGIKQGSKKIKRGGSDAHKGTFVDRYDRIGQSLGPKIEWEGKRENHLE